MTGQAGKNTSSTKLSNAVTPKLIEQTANVLNWRFGRHLSPGTERFKYAYVWRTLMKAGVHVAGGSDAPVEAPTPLVGMADVTRREGLDFPYYHIKCGHYYSYTEMVK